MLKKYPKVFTSLMVGLFDLEMSFYHSDRDSDEAKQAVTVDNLDSLSHHLKVAGALAEELSLESLPPLIRRMTSRIAGPTYLESDAHEDITQLRSRIEDHLSSRLFLFIPTSRVEQYEGEQLFGGAVNDRFPAAVDDIEDAGRSLALGQGTACVLHLMRVMEVGLKGLAAGLGIPYAPSWESFLTQIQNKIATPRKRKTKQWIKQETFYRDVSGDLMTVKQAFRNPTMHVGRRYSPDEAEEIFRAVRAFMQRLATGLPPHVTKKP